MRTHLAIACSALLGTGVLVAQSPELPPVTTAMKQMVAELRLEGAGLAVVTADTELHRSEHGDFAADQVLPIASASKWLAVALILTLVDEGKLDLDVPVARYVKEFDRSDKQALTLRLCLAHTGGVPPRLSDRMRGQDMAKFAAAAADAALRDNPGSAFRYGGVGFQIAAVAAERVTGKSWHELFAERIAAPLGLTHTKFGKLQPLGGEAGTTALPWAAGGAVSTLADYTRFLQMLVGKGTFAGRTILAEASVAAMWRDHVPEMVEVRSVGFDGQNVRYGLGTWIERLDGGVVRVSDPGALGFTPWIDLDLGVGGVLAVRDRVGRVLGNLRAVQETVRQVARSPIVAGTETTVSLEHGGRDRRYHLHVPPGAEGAAGLPLLVVLHGGGGSGEQVRESTRLAEIGTRAGFVVVFPDGTGPLRGRLLTWNSGGIPVYAAEHDVDDTGFLRAVVVDTQKRVAIDPRRVFAVGHSNGAMMCHRLAREATDVFVGIAAVAGAMNFTAVDATSPIAVLLVHGSADEHVRYDGGAPGASIGRSGDRVDASVQQAIEHYLGRNDALGYPETKVEGKVRIDTYAAGRSGKSAAAPLRVITLEGGGHAWPGAVGKTRAVADTPFPFDASRAIVDFFASLQPMPAGGSPVAPR
jgi:polyhydroxybutyrate depolymerase